MELAVTVLAADVADGAITSRVDALLFAGALVATIEPHVAVAVELAAERRRLRARAELRTSERDRRSDEGRAPSSER